MATPARELDELFEGQKLALTRIEGWIDDPLSVISWLEGPSGCGKSTVAAAVRASIIAHPEARRPNVGFSFSRAQPHRNRYVFLDLAIQLESQHWTLHAISRAIRLEPEISHSTLENQFDKLIRAPLQNLPPWSTPFLIILDALDECDDAEEIVRLVGNTRFAANIMFLFTSRPAPHFRVALRSVVTQLEDHSLGAETLSIVKRDIKAYLQALLPSQIKQYDTLSQDWPGSEKIQMLADMSGGLISWADIVVRFISRRGVRDPEERLAIILRQFRKHEASDLDSLYATILDHEFPPDSSDSLFRQLPRVLGALIVLRAPVNIPTIASLLSSDHACTLDPEAVLTILTPLEPIFIGVKVDDPLYTVYSDLRKWIYPSFLDYIVDESRCGSRFLIDVADHTQYLARACFKCMEDLQRGLSQLPPLPFPPLSKRFGGHFHSWSRVSPGLKYACLSTLR